MTIPEIITAFYRVSMSAIAVSLYAITFISWKKL